MTLDLTKEEVLLVLQIITEVSMPFKISAPLIEKINKQYQQSVSVNETE